jgi:hypothetical protein
MKKQIPSKHVQRLRSVTRKKHAAQPRTAEQYFAKTRRFQNLWDRVVTVVSKIRGHKTSLQQAAREIGISPRTVLRWAGSALQKNARGRYTAKPSDQLLRVLMVPTPDGPSEIAIRGSRKAKEIGEYWNAVHRLLETGDESALQKFEGKFLTDVDGNRLPFLTDRTQLKRLGSAGVLSFESIYWRNV